MKLYELSDDPERRIFLDKLIRFNEERGSPMTNGPTLSKQPLDLFRLYLCVKERAGFLEVCFIIPCSNGRNCLIHKYGFNMHLLRQNHKINNESRIANGLRKMYVGVYIQCTLVILSKCHVLKSSKTVHLSSKLCIFLDDLKIMWFCRLQNQGYGKKSQSRWVQVRLQALHMLYGSSISSICCHLSANSTAVALTPFLS